MKYEKLNDALARLEKSLREIDESDTESRDKLTHLIAETRQLIREPGDDRRRGLSEQVRSAVVHFETRHPIITDTLEEITRILVSLGI